MTPKRYALTIAGGMLTVWIGVMSANIVLDPECVFRLGRFGTMHCLNERYLKFREYQAERGRVDGLFFASSRGAGIPMDALSRNMGATFVDMSVGVGMIDDHLAVLAYTIRTADARHRPVKKVFLMLDTDFFGQRPFANRTIQSKLAPELTGESYGRFIWSYLIAVQFRAWSEKIKQLFTPTGVDLTRIDLFRTIERTGGGSTNDQAATDGSRGAAETASPPRGNRRVTTNPDFDNQLKELRTFVDLCRTSGIDLVVAISPLRRANAQLFDSIDLDTVVARIAEVVPVWDFGVPEWLSDRPNLWFDRSHFKPEVGLMMLDRIFGKHETNARADFGALRGGRTAAEPKS